MIVARATRSVRNRSTAAAYRLRAFRLWTLRAAGQLEGAQGAKVGRGVRLELYGRLKLGKRVHLNDGCSLHVAPGATLVLGDDVFVGRFTVVAAASTLSIGDRTMVGEHVSIRDADHSLDADERRLEWSGQRAARAEALHVADDVWIGAGARILRGASVGERAVVAANAVVRSAVPPNTIAAGVPARVVRDVAD